MNINQILKKELAKIKSSEKEIKHLKKLSMDFKDTLQNEINKEGIDAEVFIGGSFAKGTMIKEDKFDIDVFVRFHFSYDYPSQELKPVLERVSKMKNLRLEVVHGSRDYFKLFEKDKETYFEIIPVTKIKKVHEERNVTDLSYFHVGYVKKKVRGLEDHVLLAKRFMQAQRVYGAETYVKGFHGYAVECLIIHYKSFTKMLKELSKIKIGERIIIDIEKHFKRKNDIFFELNENRLNSPVILIDPIYKERNVTAALSRETFEKFQQCAKKFLENPSEDFFIEKPLDVEKIRISAKKKDAEFVHLQITTDRQEGDIAGTKLKKFADFLAKEISTCFTLIEKEFDYDEKHTADIYLAAKSKKEIIRIGPPLNMKKHVAAFKKEHPAAFEKNKLIHAKIKIDFSLKEFIEKFVKKRDSTLNEMGVTGVKVIEHKNNEKN